MPIPKLNEPTRRAGDKGGPFSSDGPLRVLIDLPADLRQVEAGPWEGPTAPVPEHILWSLCQGSSDIELHWLAQPGETGIGAVHFQEPDLSSDHWPFTFAKSDGGRVGLGAVSMYRQLERIADEDPTKSLDTYAKAALSGDLRTHITVTCDPDLLDLTRLLRPQHQPSDRGGSARGRRAVPAQERPVHGRLGTPRRVSTSVPTSRLGSPSVPNFPAGGGGAASSSTTAPPPKTTTQPSLFGVILRSALVRMLNHRDNVHRAILQRADNQTGHDATEALDNFMFNVVGAFDAAAIAAHLGAGLQFEDRRRAGWQSKNWRRELGVPHLYEMFHKSKPADDLFAVCRLLRNTVHGAGLSSVVASNMSGSETLVRLPHAEAAEIVDRLSRLAPTHAWGIDERHRGHLYGRPVPGSSKDSSPTSFRPLRRSSNTLPLERLAGTAVGREDVPTDGAFDLSTRTRTCLLYGLTPPSQ